MRQSGLSTVFFNEKRKKLSDMPTHTIHYGHIKDGDEVIDEVMVVLMRAPKSYTKEDTVEIDCHGGVYVMKRVLETVIKYGARPAERVYKTGIFKWTDRSCTGRICHRYYSCEK